MNKKQVFALFFCGLVIWTMGNSLLPLLPVYATQLGAAPTAVGAYLSLSYFCLATGTVVAGWLSDRLQRRKALPIVGGAVGIPAMWLMGRATNVRLGGRFSLLLLASIVASTAVFVGRLGTSLAMHELGFVAAAISSTGAMGGAITLPLPPLLGWLSDRVDRKRLMALCYLTGTVGLLVLTVSSSLWHFWVAAAVLSVVSYVNSGVGSALVTDLVPQESLGRGMSLFGATLWVGGFIGFAGTGYAVQSLGIGSSFTVGALLPLIAIILLIPVRRDGA